MLQKQGKFTAAIGKFDEALASELKVFKKWEVHTYKGLCHDDLKEYKEAIDCYGKALAIESGRPSVWVNKGVSHRMIEEHEKAEACYREALEIEPKYGKAHLSLGVLHIIRGDLDEAVVSLKQAIEILPSDGTAHGNLAYALARKGDFEGAEAALKKAHFYGYRRVEATREKIDILKEKAGSKGGRDEDKENPPGKASPGKEPA